jgi:hypothetical protein
MVQDSSYSLSEKSKQPQLAPFCFYNGNTFASVIALVIKRLDLDPIQALVVRSLACHIVAGVSSVEEEESFRRYCESMSG